MSLPLPYIGVTGFTQRIQVEYLMHFNWKNRRRLMIGVLASLRTIHNQENKKIERYPRAQEISKIFLPAQHLFNVIHYNTPDPNNSLLDQMVIAVELGGPHCHGIQLNMAWPDPKVLYAFKEKKPNLKVILHIGGKALQQVGSNPTEMASRLKDYLKRADYVLIDPSGGKGKAFEPRSILAYLGALYANSLADSFRFGVAGGLGPMSLHLLDPVVRKYPETSIDAEGNLRDLRNQLDLVDTEKYLAEAVKLLT